MSDFNNKEYRREKFNKKKKDYKKNFGFYDDHTSDTSKKNKQFKKKKQSLQEYEDWQNYDELY